MIRVNLLHSRKDGMQRLPAEGGASAFISGREVLLAAVFLVLGGIILWVVVSNSNGPDDAAVVAEETSAPPAPAPPEQASVPDGQADPAQVAATATPQTPAPLGSGLGEPAAVAAAVPESAASTAKKALPQQVSPPSTQSLPPTRSPSQPAPGSSVPAPPATSTGASAAPSGSLTLSAVRVFTRGPDLQIIAATNGLPEYKLFRVENPDRVVIDIPGAWLEVPRADREQAVSHPVVRQLRIAQNQLEPPLVRVVLEVNSFPELQVVPRSDGLVISVPGG